MNMGSCLYAGCGGIAAAILFSVSGICPETGLTCRSGLPLFVSPQKASEATGIFETVYGWDEASVFEAESGTLYGDCALSEDATYVTGFTKDGDGVVIPVSVAETGFYDVALVSRSQGGHKENYLLADGGNVGTFDSEDGDFADSVVSMVYLEAGEHELEVASYWGWIDLDCVKLKPADVLSASVYEIEPVLCDPDASPNAQKLMDYLCSIYGEQILSGQYCDTGPFGTENACIWKATGGTFPAVLGLDLIDASPSRVAHGTSSKAAEYALQYWQEYNGIVTMCWHWNAPEDYLTGVWYSGFYTEYTDISLARIMDGSDPEGLALLMADIDAIAAELQVLADADVPVLWRPLHEASGGWFWWGADGPEAYISLYRLLYETLTEDYGFHNLIWVWNGQDADWYPGDAYVDIIGEDLYPGERVYTSQADAFVRALQYTQEPKLVILSENGCLFDPDLAIRDGAMWGMFVTWGGEFVTDSGLYNDVSERYTELEMWQKVYAHEAVITRDELPDWEEYEVSR